MLRRRYGFSIWHNCTDKGIINALNRCCILHFADLAHIVQKYCAMESAWKAQTARWELPAFKPATGRAKRMHPYGAPNHHPIDKKVKPFMGHRTVLDDLLDKPCQIHTTPNTEPTHSLPACWVLRQVAKSGEAILTNITLERHSSEDADLNVFTVFETFSSNNRRKRALCDLAGVNQIAAVNPWNNMAITFNATDEPRARSVRAPTTLVLNPIVDGFSCLKCSWTVGVD